MHPKNCIELILSPECNWIDKYQKHSVLGLWFECQIAYFFTIKICESNHWGAWSKNSIPLIFKDNFLTKEIYKKNINKYSKNIC